MVKLQTFMFPTTFSMFPIVSVKCRIRVCNPNFSVVRTVEFHGNSADFCRLAANTHTWGRKFLLDNWSAEATKSETDSITDLMHTIIAQVYNTQTFYFNKKKKFVFKYLLLLFYNKLLIYTDYTEYLNVFKY